MGQCRRLQKLVLDEVGWLDEHGRLNLPRLYLFPADAASLADAVEMEMAAGGGSPSLDALAAFVERWRPAAPAEKGEL